MSLDSGKRIDTIVDAEAPPYGDTASDSQIQDNAYSGRPLWDKAGVWKGGQASAGITHRIGGNPDPTPPGANRARGRSVGDTRGVVDQSDPTAKLGRSSNG